MYLVGAAAMPPVFALVGALVVSIPLQYLGRRKSLIGISIPSMVAFWLMGLANFGEHKAMVYIGRMLSGFSLGFATPASQIYVRLV